MKKIISVVLIFCISVLGGFFCFSNSNETAKLGAGIEIFNPQTTNTSVDGATKMVVSGSIPALTLRDLVCDSTIIIKGKVNKLLPSRWSNEGYKKGKDIRNVLQTDIIIDIEKVYKGTPYDSKQIAVRIDKGQTDDMIVESDGYPDFTSGEDVILFLAIDDGDAANANENYYVLKGMAQGKFSLTQTNNIYTNNKEEIEVEKINHIIKENLELEKANPREKMTKEEIKKNNEKYFGK